MIKTHIIYNKNKNIDLYNYSSRDANELSTKSIFNIEQENYTEENLYLNKNNEIFDIKKNFQEPTVDPMEKITDDIVSLINKKSLFSREKKDKKLKEYILNNIGPENILNFLSTYHNKTGKDFITEIYNTKDNKYAEEILSHISDSYSCCTEDANPKYSQYISSVLIDDFYSNKKDGLMDHLMLLFCYVDFPSVITEYNKQAREYEEQIKPYSTNLPLNNESLKKINHLNNLLSAINDEASIDNETKSMYLTALINFSVETGNLDKIKNDEKIKQIVYQIATANVSSMFDSKNKYTADIKYDMKQHPNDTIKNYIDLKRLARRPEQYGEVNLIETNSFDVPFYQYRNTGDCWLLAGLQSFIHNKEARAILENCCTYNEQTDTYKIDLKGIGKTYYIQQESRKESTQYANGNSKIRAIEIAIDTYYKENAYHIQDDDVIDINANEENELFRLFLGDSKISKFEYIPELKETLNDKSKLFTVLFHYNEDELDVSNFAINLKDNTPAEICTNHLFAFIRSDEQFFYLGDTADSENIIKISIENFERLKATIGCGDLK